MADERTASTFTWLNSNLRARQLSQSIVRMTQIRQWHKYQQKVGIVFSCVIKDSLALNPLLELQQNSRSHTRPPPTVKFRDLSQVLGISTGSVTGNSASEPEGSDTSDSDSECESDEEDLDSEEQLRGNVPPEYEGCRTDTLVAEAVADLSTLR